MNDTFSNSTINSTPIEIPLIGTKFAPAGRDAASDIHHKKAVLDHVPLLAKTLDAMPGMVLILNRNRQIIAANKRFLNILDVGINDIAEKRPGEAIKCIRATEGADGCGTGSHCATCGAVNAILGAISNNSEVIRECRILVYAQTEVVPLDLRVTATPFEVDEEFFILAAMEDISHEKRQEVLQRTFFHDVLNTAGCIQGYAEFMSEEAATDLDICDRLTSLSKQLIEEIQSQRDLLHAEVGELKTTSMPVKGWQVMNNLRDQYINHNIAALRNIIIGDAWNGPIVTDERLLKRVLGNMLKNALEATPPHGSVEMNCREDNDAVVFSIKNPEVMQEDVQLQIFQRSFSTKNEPGRGIGTYSMKLFGEKYLGGEVDFTSCASEGTTFSLRLPKKPTHDIRTN